MQTCVLPDKADKIIILKEYNGMQENAGRQWNKIRKPMHEQI